LIVDVTVIPALTGFETSENVYTPFPLAAVNTGEVNATPNVVTKFVAPETIGGPLTVIVITVEVSAPSVSVAVMVSK
jgi:hypothetical protein